MNTPNPELQKLWKKIDDLDEKMRQLWREQERIGSCNNPKWQALDKERFELMARRRELVKQQDQFL